MKDAIGQPIKEGFAVQVDNGRGSVYAMKTYVIGTKGKQVLLLGERFEHTPLEQLVEDYKAGVPDVPKRTKTPTRIIMLGGNS